MWNLISWNLNQMVNMNFWKVRIGLCFQKSFCIEFFLFLEFFVPNGYVIQISKWNFIFMDFMGFSFKIFKMISPY
jgi:hypothetical protein